MTMPRTNPALDAAYADFEPSLADINTAALNALAKPTGLKGIGGTLEGDLGSDPDLFIPYLIAMDTLNFQFWRGYGADFVRYQHEGQQGALAMQAAFQRAWLAELPPGPGAASLERSATAARELRARIEAGGLAAIFGDIPAPEKRVELLLEVLNPMALIQAAQAIRARCERDSALGWRDALGLSLVFPQSYADRYLKKAQLTMMFIAGQWQQATGVRIALDVSAAADYQLPKVLASLGLLTYSAKLKAQIDAGKCIKRGSAEERAIRAATVLACQALCSHFACGVAEVDFWLWSNRNADKAVLYHRTVTTDY